MTFFPSPGLVEELLIPSGENVRFDSMLYEGYVVPPFYDSLIGKLVVLGESREGALKKMRNALTEMQIRGIDTTIPLHRQLIDNKQVQDGIFDTNFLELLLSENDK